MREIKFRAWDGTEMYTPIIGRDGKPYRDDRDYEDANPAIHDNVMQYTGLKDKNGKDVYEGDILDCTCELVTNFGTKRTGVMATTLYQVLWRGEGWGKRVIDSKQLVVGSESDGLEITLKYSVVIGNIYEHAHLLEVKQDD